MLVGLETAEDAGVYLLDENTALVQTADFITPVVDDPYTYGQIAVANALSDIYAMGGTPITAINLVMFATCKVPESYLREILQGGADKLREAGVSLIGGHTVDDLETKYGLAVTGIVHPQKIIKNSTAKPGDILYYTKPLGIGVVTTAIKADMADRKTVEEASRVMTTLNRAAAEAMKETGVNACTDITGFGFLGHLYEMVRYSNVNATIHVDGLEFLPQAIEFAEMGLFPAATYENMDYAGHSVTFENGIKEEIQLLLFDPQTSGGLLISVPPEKAESFENTMKKKKVNFYKAGIITEKGTGKITVRK